MSFLGSIFGSNSSNPANAAMPYLNQIPGVAQENLAPWQQQGQQAQQQNQQQYQKMASNPGDFLAELRASYSPSAGYKFREDQARKAAEGAAAAGGRTGTSANQAAQAKLVKDLMGEDEAAYLDRILGIQGTGLQGNENIATRGYGASGDLTNVLGSNLSQQGTLAYKGKENQNAASQGLGKLLAQLAGGGIGFALGGPAGAAIGSGLGGSLGGGGGNSSGPSNYEQFGLGMGGGLGGGAKNIWPGMGM